MICVQDDQYVIDSLMNLCPGWPMGLILVQLFFNQFVPRSTGWRTSWWASRRSWRGSPRSWSRPSPRCPDISSSRNGWALVLTWADLCQNVWILLPPRTDLYWDVWLFLQTWTDFYHPDVPGKSKPCLRRINISFCCHVIIHSVIQWSHKRILSAPRLSEIAVFQKKEMLPKIYLSFSSAFDVGIYKNLPGRSPTTGIHRLLLEMASFEWEGGKKKDWDGRILFRLLFKWMGT